MVSGVDCWNGMDLFEDGNVVVCSLFHLGEEANVVFVAYMLEGNATWLHCCIDSVGRF